MTDLADLSISEARGALDSGRCSAAELLEAVWRRASVSEAHLHGYLTLDREGAEAAARRSDETRARGERAGAKDRVALAGLAVLCRHRGRATTGNSQDLIA